MLKRTGRNFSWPSAGNASSWLRYVEAVDMMSCLSILNWGISKLFIPAFRSFQWLFPSASSFDKQVMFLASRLLFATRALHSTSMLILLCVLGSSFFLLENRGLQRTILMFGRSLAVCTCEWDVQPASRGKHEESFWFLFVDRTSKITSFLIKCHPSIQTNYPEFFYKMPSIHTSFQDNFF